ncbi:hypothetical protein [Allomuricauda sp. SCSIO 65647]|uniref:hypothetical protein n=1 Tax=Allomuricauda sp. SCSIO 65647 TaxID=2908843 RepID=UPI001F2BB34B|nr:hypothetical protein [Muricauda sp. SCSIO 65647]UJH66384.1 hypothetical protein L0P89_10435 [Muricauda sp. SCSIO 65647]
MNEPCYIKLDNDDKLSIELFNISVFDVLLLFDMSDSIYIDEFYAVDNLELEDEVHLTEKDLPKKCKISDFYQFLDKRGDYGNSFTINELNAHTENIALRLKDDYLVTFYMSREHKILFYDLLRKALRLLKFINIEDTVSLLSINFGRYIVFDDEAKVEIFEKYSELSKAKIFSAE